MHAEMTDESLMLAFRDGDHRAFEELYGRHKRYLYRFFERQLFGRARNEIDELFHDVWRKVVEARLRYEVTAGFRTWLTRIAHNRLVDFFRANGRAEFVEATDEEIDPLADMAAAPDDDPLRQLDRQRTVQAIDAALRALPAAQREAFILHHESEMTLDEISAAIGVNAETVKSRLRYAYAKLRKALEALR